jgi:hypothetical protein
LQRIASFTFAKHRQYFDMGSKIESPNGIE